MTNDQWQRLLNVVRNRNSFAVEVCLIVDSPFLPGFAGYSTLEYLTTQEKWLEAQLQPLRYRTPPRHP